MSTFFPSRRGTIRVAVTAAACAGAVLAGATTAWANPYDITGDGVADQYQFDVDGDGFVDNWWTDVDNDGTVDEFVFDLDRNTVPELWAVDRDHDRHWDQLQVDTNGDGYPDTLLTGFVADTVWGSTYQTPTATGSLDCLAPGGYLPAEVPVYGDCAWMQTMAQNSGLGPTPWDVVGDAIDAAFPGPL